MKRKDNDLRSLSFTFTKDLFIEGIKKYNYLKKSYIMVKFTVIRFKCN